MVIQGGFPLCMSFLIYLGFTVETVYYGGKKLKYQQFPPEVSSWAPVSCGSNCKFRHWFSDRNKQ